MTIGIDRDFVDAPTAAYGSGTFVSQVVSAPSLIVKPQANGWVDLTPSWAGEPGITSYALLGGRSATALTAIETVSAAAKFPIKLQDSYAYFVVQALNSLGQVVGTSAPVQTPASVAIFGNSAYVGAKGPVGIPVACLNVTPCEARGGDLSRARSASPTARSASVSAHGGQLLVPLSTQTRKLVSGAPNRRLPVTVTLTSSTGAKATRPLNLIPYTISGKAPVRRSWPSSTLQILGETSFVSNAWTGGILAPARRARRAWRPRASPSVERRSRRRTRRPSVPGEVGYLTYPLNKKGHKLLRERSAISSAHGSRSPRTAPSTTGAAAATGGSKTATALISLDSFR